jgi:hypothetical protein
MVNQDRPDSRPSIPYDRKSLKADMVLRCPKAGRTFVILSNGGLRPCQTMKIARRPTIGSGPSRPKGALGQHSAEAQSQRAHLL